MATRTVTKLLVSDGKLVIDENSGVHAISTEEEFFTDIQYFTFVGNAVTGYNVAGGLDVAIPAKTDLELDVLTLEANLFYPNSTPLGITSVDIPSTVTNIKSQACRGNPLTSIAIPEGVTSIGSYAFMDCALVDNLVLPDSLATLSNGAFWNNSGITSITVPASISFIDFNVFKDCSIAGSLSFPATLTSIKSNAFENNNITSVTFDGTLLRDIAGFQGNNITGQLVIPEGVTSLGVYAFKDNINMTGVSFPSTLNSIANGAFWNNVGLTGHIELPEGLTSIGNSFMGCAITSVTIPSSLSTIGSMAFRLNSIMALTIPEGVTAIGDNAFDTNQIASLSLPSSLTTIGNAVFQHNNITGNLDLSTMPLNSIGYSAFGFNDITSVTLPGTISEISEHCFRDNNINPVIVIPEGVATLSFSCFAYNENLSTVVLPSSLVTIEQQAFTNCPVEHILIGSGVTILVDNGTMGNNGQAFIDLYEGNGKQAGQYDWNGSAWIKTV